MDWNAAIGRNQEALKRVLAAMLAMAGFAAGRPATLPRHLHRAVLRLLRPAEAAARRLVILAAREMRHFQLSPLRGRPEARARPAARPGRGAGRGGEDNSKPRVRRPCLPLFDPPSRFARRQWCATAAMPRISLPGITRLAPLRPAPMPFDPLDTTRLAFRLAGLAAALEHLPRQAARFARWQARRQTDRGISCPRRVWPLRPGRPPCRPPARLSPGAQLHAVHDILDTVHGLALLTLEPADTS